MSFTINGMEMPDCNLEHAGRDILRYADKYQRTFWGLYCGFPIEASPGESIDAIVMRWKNEQENRSGEY